MANIAGFAVDKEKCIGCGLCTKVCPGQLLWLDDSHTVSMTPVEEFGWSGCWKCEHCMAVCPKGAIRILGKKPENSPAKPDTAQGIFPKGFDRKSYEDMKRWETSVRPDMVFCGAPHLLIPHAPWGQGEPVCDVNIAAAYFELLCAAHGLGCSLLTFPLGVLNTMLEVKALLKIPEDHYIGMLIGFGYPEIAYARGTQRRIESERVWACSGQICC